MTTDLTEIDEKSPSTHRMPSAAVQRAIEGMVWQGYKRADAAKYAGLQPKSFYHALRLPHVKAHYLAELEVLRTSGRARAFHRLEELAEQDENRGAAVRAIETILRIAEDPSAVSGNPRRAPGVVIVIGNPAVPAQSTVIDVGTGAGTGEPE